MSELSPLINIFKEQLGWHQSRISFLANFVIALIRVRTVRLTYHFIRTFGKDRIGCFAVDIGFIGKERIGYPGDEKILFRIRIRKNTQVPNARGKRKTNAYFLSSTIFY